MAFLPAKHRRCGHLACILFCFLPPALTLPVPTIVWHAPVFSHGGYGSEARSLITGLQAAGVPVAVAQHGDAASAELLAGLPPAEARTLEAAAQAAGRVRASRAVSVCHSEPGAWHFPGLPRRYSTPTCPLPGARATVGRTMFETDRLPAGWAERCNRMDQVWVPTSFAKAVFVAGGVDPNKIRVVPEPVDSMGPTCSNCPRTHTIMRTHTQSSYTYTAATSTPCIPPFPPLSRLSSYQPHFSTLVLPARPLLACRPGRAPLARPRVPPPRAPSAFSL